MSLSAPSPTISASLESRDCIDLDLDPSDPLNLLLHNNGNSDSFMEDPSREDIQPDWAQLSSLWAPYEGSNDTSTKPFDLDFNIPMDMETMFNNPEAIDPNALNIDYTNKLGFNFNDDSYNLTSELLSGRSYEFPFQSAPSPVHSVSSSDQSSRSRRMSVTSLSSSSISMSPISDMAMPQTSPVPSPYLTTPSDPAAELARRVLQAAGILLAVPASAQNNASLLSQQHSPNLPQFVSSGTSSGTSTPPPPTPPSDNVSPPPASMSSSSMGIIGRPKTSHTTIERRYRTNLNARIQSLRMVVPALRVVEDRDGNGGSSRKVKVKVPVGRVLTTGRVKREGSEGFVEEEIVDIVDERGFVDGVKVARKCSKANVLGKAVEYIRVLKKRENRLKREQDGLKSLVSGLVGGPALLAEWQREWKERFGGEERDEVEDEIEELISDDEGSGDDDEEDEGRKRKKQKVQAKPKDALLKIKTNVSQTALVNGAAPEKRKRGRPRKVATPSAPVISPPVFASPTDQKIFFPPQNEQQDGRTGAQQYLLATFALFSFFNSPFASSYPSANHTHTGSVLTAHEFASPESSRWHDAVQGFHLLVSILVFASIIMPWIPIKQLIRRNLSFWKAVPKSAVTIQGSHSSNLVQALAQENRGSPYEVTALRSALDLHTGFFNAFLLPFSAKARHDAGKVSYEQRGLEQRAWVRLGEICVLKGERTSSWTRVNTFWHMRSHLSWFTCSASDLSTLALVISPLGRLAKSRAEELWTCAKGRKGVSGGVAHERLVLESMSIDEASRRLDAARKVMADGWEKRTPIGNIALTLVRERLKSHLGIMFIQSVLPGEVEVISPGGVPVEDVEEHELRITIDATRSLGGKSAEMGHLLEMILCWTADEVDDSWLACEDDGVDPLEQDINALLKALILYRRAFPSSIRCSSEAGTGISILLSPPPSPNGHKDSHHHYVLRRVLGCRVFDSSNNTSLEDARDRIVDLLTISERRKCD